jgi:sugar O-acyltransferase (sialic acid O-acetyltransferase NeuD family)
MRVVVLGSGGLAREYAMWAMDAGVKIDAFVNDMDPAPVVIRGVEYPCVGFEGEAVYILGVAKRKTKLTMLHKAMTAGWQPLPAVIHPRAIVESPLPDGVLVAPGCVITCGVKMGLHCTFNLNTTVGHDTTLGDGVTTNPGVHISGNVTVGNWCEFGTGAVVRDGVTICDDVIVGASAAVVKPIDDPGVYAGVPCVRLR